MRHSKNQSALFESAFTNAPIGMALIDLNRRRVRVNSAFCRLVGRTSSELIGRSVSDSTHPDDVDIDASDRERLLRGEITSYQVEKRYVHAWGHHVWTLVTVSLIRDAHGEAIYYISQVQDITERKVHDRRLRQIADHDFLTGVFNRRHFEHVLADELQREQRYGQSGAVLLIDLDHFKGVNDRFGHLTGDDLLRHVATMLRDRVRRTDTLARLGGDEFAVILPHTNQAQAQHLADGIVKALRRQTVVLGDRAARVSASVGVFCFDGSTAEQTMANVDVALYEAKRAGRDRLSMYAPEAGRPKAASRISDTRLIREALDEGRLCLYCQPIVDLSAGTVTQYELLLRIQAGPGATPLLPAAFLGTAERAGLLQLIDGWVVRQAVDLLARGRAARAFGLNVNVSAKSIGDPQFAAIVEDTLKETPIDPSLLVFELSETVALSDIDQARVFARRMQELGCRIALDDFGVGFGSFQYVKHLPFDVLKIDGEFIRDLTPGTIDQVVVKAIVGISTEMRKKTVAECVESAAMARFLKESGVDFAQGYYLGVPTPVAEVLQMA
jgi:diguanylate cyclase (GGDEF)-like protein/PAS domain S-box-containing protein